MSENIEYNVALSIFLNRGNIREPKRKVFKYIASGTDNLNDITGFYCCYYNNCEYEIPCEVCWETEINKKYEWYKGLLQKLEAIHE